uniref:Nitroreductase domain-containing protein n=1 Tax=Dictyoglomus thermophilum TaxID=14 RepID=A0A7C3MK30_DICTH
MEEEKLKIILECAIYAPSARNVPPWFFTVIQNKALLNKINEDLRQIMLSSEDAFIRERAKKKILMSFIMQIQ